MNPIKNLVVVLLLSAAFTPFNTKNVMAADQTVKITLTGKPIPLPAKASTEMVVDPSVQRLFVMIIGAKKAPQSHLVSPTGKTYDDTVKSDEVLKFSTPKGEMVQWSIVHVAPGAWTLKLDSPDPADQLELSANNVK